MQTDSDPKRFTTTLFKLPIQVIHSPQNIPTGEKSSISMVGVRIAGAEQGHETVTEIFVYHAPMLFHGLDGDAKELVEHLNYVRWLHGCGLSGRRSDVHEHDRDLLFHAAQARIAFQYLLRGALAYVQSKCLPQFLFLFQPADHVV